MSVLDFFFPKRCLGCGRVGEYFCAACRKKIVVIKRPICPECGRPAFDSATHPGCRGRYTIDGLTSFFRYESIIQKAVKALKYRFVSDLATEFVSLIPQDLFPKSSCLIPIPLYPTRLRERGYNQAEVMGKLIAAKLNIVMRTDILRRTKQTVPQVEKKQRKDRLKNMEKVFSVSSPVSPNILLFDDVFTTGATMRSAANVLKRNGAKIVWGITMAR